MISAATNLLMRSFQTSIWREGFHCRALVLGGYLALASIASGAVAGRVVAWGANDHNQLHVPAGLNDAIAVSAGQYHSLALKSDGTVVAWGENGDGQGSVPAGLSNVVAISAGYMHNLALKQDGTVVAWGNNWYGQGAASSDLTNISRISAGYLHNIVLRSNGVAVAWGWNGYGQTTVPNNSNIVDVAAGGLLTMILKNTGMTVGFGNLAFGSVGGAQAVAPGYEHNMALLSNGTVVAWGNATWLQTSVPSSLNGVAAVSGTHYHCLALRTNGVVVGWGRNDQGQGRPPAWLTNALAVSTGELHSLAIIPNPPAPKLSIRVSLTDVVLTWPVPEEAFVLTSATNLGSPFTLENPLLSTNAQGVSATLPVTGAQKFFRLRKP